MKILITGATGFIGQELGKALVRKGHEIFAVSRSQKSAELHLTYPAHIIEGDLNKTPLDSAKLKDIEVAIHLAGENVGSSRWTNERKEKIRNSRTQTTANLLQSLPKTLQTLVSASATGVYGNRGDEVLTEDSSHGAGFLAQVCQDWEKTTQEDLKKFPNTRHVTLRSGVVFGSFGGAFTKMLTPFRFNLGGVLGDGEQWMSWIHLDDMVALYVKAIEDSKMHGIYNAVAPEPVTNKQFTMTLVTALDVHQGPPVPKMALKLLFGEMSSAILDSQKVKSERLQNFKFQYPTLQAALDECAAPYKAGDEVFYAEQFIDLPKSKVFDFFSKAENLETITPPMLNFRIEKKSTETVTKGTLIDYRLKIRGVPVGWQTLIEEWKPDDVFIDSQLKGPYSKWHHTHSFETLGTGTLMKDFVRYRMPLKAFGKIASPLVRSDVEKIFDYRRENVARLI